MAESVYGTFRQDVLQFSITNVSSISDDKNPTFTYAWERTNRNWTLTVDNAGTGATLSEAHAGETGSVTVTVTETKHPENNRVFGGAVETRGFPAN